MHDQTPPSQSPSSLPSLASSLASLSVPHVSHPLLRLSRRPVQFAELSSTCLLFLTRFQMLWAQPRLPPKCSHSGRPTPVPTGGRVAFFTIPFIFTIFSLLLERLLCGERKIIREKKKKKSRPSETCFPCSASPHTFPFGLIACCSLWAFERQISERQLERVNMKWAARRCPPCWGTCVLEAQEKWGESCLSRLHCLLRLSDASPSWGADKAGI